MRAFTRNTYAFILQLHPQEFRAEFGDEMLWIFDKQMHCCDSGAARVVLCAQLLLDAFRSAFIQRALREQHQHKTLGPHFGQIGSSAYVIQVAEGGFIVLCCLFCVFSMAIWLHMVISNL